MPPEHPVSPIWLDVVATQLTRSGVASLEASHELVAHYGDTGDPATQRAVETLIDNAAEALAAISDGFAESSRVLQDVAQRDNTRGPGQHA